MDQSPPFFRTSIPLANISPPFNVFLFQSHFFHFDLFYILYSSSHLILDNLIRHTNLPYYITLKVSISSNQP